MKHTVSTTVKFSKALKKIHNLKVKYLNNSILFSALSDIYSDVELLFDMYNKHKLSDREKVIASVLKLEKATKERYKKKEDKIKLKEWKINKERKKIGYLKHRARVDFKVKRKLKEKFGDNFFSNIKKDTKDSILANNKFILDELK